MRKQIDLANAQIKTLDETLKFWQEYGKEQIDAALSVADAIKALEALMFPEGGKPRLVAHSVGQTSQHWQWWRRAKWKRHCPPKDGRAVYSDGSTQSSAGSNVSDVADRLAAGQSAPTYMGELMGQGGYDWDEEESFMYPKFDVGTNRVPRDMLP